MNDKNIVQMPDGYLNKTPLFQFILLSCLFPLWGCAAALNDILITQFKSVFSLSNFASALVQSAFYGGYFLIAIPASLVIKKTSYKVAILIGLTLYIVGCTLFFSGVAHGDLHHVPRGDFRHCDWPEFPGNGGEHLQFDDRAESLRHAAAEYQPDLLSDRRGGRHFIGKYLVFSEGESLENRWRA